jgi:hypothetical protein
MSCGRAGGPTDMTTTLETHTIEAAGALIA